MPKSAPADQDESARPSKKHWDTSQENYNVNKSKQEIELCAGNDVNDIDEDRT